MSEEITPDEGEVVEVPEEQVEAPQEAPKSNLQDRFDKITRQKYEAIQQSESLEKQNKELQAKLDAIPEAPEPTLENNDYDDEAYTKAVTAQLVDSGVKKAMAEQEAERQQGLDRQSQETISREFAGREAQFSSSVEDYDAVAKNGMLPINDVMAHVIKTSDNGPAIAYHLGKHPDEAYNISNMDQYSAQKALIQIEMGFKKPQLVSEAPAPMDVSVSGQGGGGSIGLSDDLSSEEWQRRRAKQLGR